MKPQQGRSDGGRCPADAQSAGSPGAGRSHRLWGGSLRTWRAAHGLTVLALLLVSACGVPRRDPAVPLSLRAQRVCRERMAELPPGTDPRRARQAYSLCLRNVDRPAAAVSPSSSPAASPSSSSEAGAVATVRATQPEAGAGASAEERYLHCRLHSEEIAAAAVAYDRARWALLNSPADPASPERQQAEAGLSRALEGLGEAIPPRVRGGMDLVPDALLQFQRCERSRFE